MKPCLTIKERSDRVSPFDPQNHSNIANVADHGFENNHYLDQVRGIAEAEGAMVVFLLCNKLEAENIEFRHRRNARIP